MKSLKEKYSMLLLVGRKFSIRAANGHKISEFSYEGKAIAENYEFWLKKIDSRNVWNRNAKYRISYCRTGRGWHSERAFFSNGVRFEKGKAVVEAISKAVEFFEL